MSSKNTVRTFAPGEKSDDAAIDGGAFNLTGINFEENDETLKAPRVKGKTKVDPLQLHQARIASQLRTIDPALLEKKKKIAKNNEWRSTAKSSARKVKEDDLQVGGVPVDYKVVDPHDPEAKYFGAHARVRFFGRMRWIGRQRCILDWKTDTETDKLYFNNEEPDVDFPHSPRRKTKLHSEKKNGANHGAFVPQRPGTELNDPEDDLDDPFDEEDWPSPHEIDLCAHPISPRSMYIDKCLRGGMNPRAGMLIRRDISKELVLTRLGIGDEMATYIAESLCGIPSIECINLSDNRLTDAGMAPILKSLVSIPELLELDMSYNEIGEETSACLAQYMGRKDCPLKVLCLRAADLDDGECAGFVEALSENKTLTSIDLSYNLIGSAENLNTVYPDFTTGGEALAEWLADEECVLKTLVLEWNMIRLDSAIQLAQALHTNISLTYLDLSYNSLATDGGLALGDAIIDNRTLKTLRLNNNNITSTACFTICIGAIENIALTELSMGGNPIGTPGANALMLVPLTVGDRIKISAVNCNILIRDSTCWFNPQRPCSDYRLNLSHPFERAIAFKLLRLVASHPTYVFKYCNYVEEVDGRLGRNTPLNLVQIIDPETERLMTEDRNKICENLRKVIEAASDHDKAVELFHETDEDGSGELDAEEMMVLMENLGIPCDMDRIEEVINEVDISGEGQLDFDEFFLFLRQLGKEAKNRLKDLTEFPVMALKELTGSKKPRYLPPRSGIMVCEVVDSFKLKSVFRSISAVDHDYAQSVASESGESHQMLAHAVSHAKLRLQEAMEIYKTMVNESRNKIICALKLLPQINNTLECKQFVKKVFKNDRTGLMQLKLALGQCINPMFGHVNGFYSLDLSKEFDRLCLSQLLEKSRTACSKKASLSEWGGFGCMRNTSQDGNWSCFRNEIFNGEGIEITTRRFIPMPRSGKLEFDYSTIDRPEVRALLIVSVISLVVVFSLSTSVCVSAAFCPAQTLKLPVPK
jgi:hypothetical protein